MKYFPVCFCKKGDAVAPFAGAWIEIAIDILADPGTLVAPFAGAWIEIKWNYPVNWDAVSLPSRERGLKYKYA